MLTKELKRRSQRLLVELNESLEDKDLFKQISHCMVELRKAGSSSRVVDSSNWAKEAELKDTKCRLMQAEDKIRALRTELEHNKAYVSQLAEKIHLILLPKPFEHFRVFSMTNRPVDALTIARAMVKSLNDPVPLRRISMASDLYIMVLPENDGLIGLLLTKAQFTAMTPDHIDPDQAMAIMREAVKSLGPDSDYQQGRDATEKAKRKVLAMTEDGRVEEEVAE